MVGAAMSLAAVHLLIRALGGNLPLYVSLFYRIDFLTGNIAR